MKRVLIALNKPYDVLTKFTDDQGRATLKDFVPCRMFIRLAADRNSGFVAATNDGGLQARIAEPRYRMPKRIGRRWKAPRRQNSSNVCVMASCLRTA